MDRCCFPDRICDLHCHNRAAVRHCNGDYSGVRRCADSHLAAQLFVANGQIQLLDHRFQYETAFDQLRIVLNQLCACLQVIVGYICTTVVLFVQNIDLCYRLIRGRHQKFASPKGQKCCKQSHCNHQRKLSPEYPKKFCQIDFGFLVASLVLIFHVSFPFFYSVSSISVLSRMCAAFL